MTTIYEVSETAEKIEDVKVVQITQTQTEEVFSLARIDLLRDEIIEKMTSLQVELDRWDSIRASVVIEAEKATLTAAEDTK